MIMKGMKGHRPRRADVPSYGSVPFLNSLIVLDDADLDHTVAMAVICALLGLN